MVEVIRREVTEQVQPEVKEPVTEPVVETPKEESLVTKVSKFVEDEKPKTEPKVDEHFDINDIDKIEDPNARDIVKKAYKSFERGYQKKFQDLADIRRDLEQKTGETWTPERVQALLNDNDFVQAAQQVAKTPEEEEYSNLTDSEKRALAETQKQMQALTYQNQILLKQQQDKELMSKYADYNPQAVDTLTNDLLKGNVQATREHLYKVINYESAVERAYKLGMKDARAGIQENVNAAAPQANTVVASSEPVKPLEGETKQALWRRIVANNIAKQKDSSIRN